MTIAPAVASPVSDFIRNRLSYDYALGVFSGLEAAFYGSLQTSSAQASRFVTWIRHNTVVYATEIQAIFNAINFASICFCSYRLVTELCNKYSKLASANTLLCINIPLALVGFSWIYEKTMRADPDPRQVSSEVQIVEQRGWQQKIATVLQNSQIILNIALAVFAKDRLPFLLNLAPTAYNLYTSAKMRWLSFVYGNASDQAISYDVLDLNQGFSNTACIVCDSVNHRSDAALPSIHLCADHVAHEACVGDRLQEARISNTVTAISSSGLNLCPSDCAEPLGRNQLNRGDEAIELLNSSLDTGWGLETFEYLYAGYSSLQAALTYFQSYPELAATIFTIQKVLLIPDLIGLTINVCYVYEGLREAYESRIGEVTFNILAIAAVVTTVVASYFIMVKIQAGLKCALVLKDVLAQLGLDAKILQTISIDWNAPPIHKFMQCVYLNRMIASISLAFLSQNSGANLTSFAAQLFSFTGISRLRWIEFERAVSGYANFPAWLTQLKMRTYFLVSAACTESMEHCRSAVQAIYQETETLLRGLHSWHLYWLIQYRHGVETSRRLMADVSIAPLPQHTCACTVGPYLDTFDMAVNGSIPVNIR